MYFSTGNRAWCPGALGVLSTDSGALVGGHAVRGRGGAVFPDPGLVFLPRLLRPWVRETRSSRCWGTCLASVLQVLSCVGLWAATI